MSEPSAPSSGVRAQEAFIIIDCADPERLAGFWADLLGRKPKPHKGPYVFLTYQDGDAFGLGFQRVDEPRSGKNRVHPDFVCADVHVAAARVLELGGSRVPGYERGGFLVMADPEGNEFCLLPNTPFEIDDDGNVTYLIVPTAT
jgi:predicted enzyme related to lactoylglutathione lyase